MTNIEQPARIEKCEIRVLDQGVALMSGATGRRQAGRIPSYLLQHQHEALECGVVFAAFKGHESPLRHRATLASCSSGGHAIWWTVEASSPAEALALLPFFVAERTTATSVTQVDIP